MDNCRAAWGMCLQGDNCPLSIINCQLSIESPVLTSHFPDLPFSGNAHFRKIVPIRKTRVKYFKIHSSERIVINTYLHNYTVSNTKKASAEPISTLESTYDWLRTDERLPSYRRVRTKTPTCPHFLEPEGARFPMCDFASFRVKRPTEGNGQTGKWNRRKRNRREYRQCVFRESREKGLPGHQSVFWCNRGHSQAVRLTF